MVPLLRLLDPFRPAFYHGPLVCLAILYVHLASIIIDFCTCKTRNVKWPNPEEESGPIEGMSCYAIYQMDFLKRINLFIELSYFCLACSVLRVGDREQRCEPNYLDQACCLRGPSMLQKKHLEV